MIIFKKGDAGHAWTVLFTAFLLAVGLVGSPLWAADPPEKMQMPVAGANFDANSITWSPKVPNAGFKLTVSCPDGSVFQRVFKSGEATFVETGDLFKGKTEIDGSYTYELRVLTNTKKKAEADEERGIMPTFSLTQSGYFTVKNGRIVSGDTPELMGDQPDDIIHQDDVIIQFSLCVGNDCNNGESFGFDTLRLKENNLRIHFQDTSISASFPTRDWRIVINDSSNGGANYFAVEDSDSGRMPFLIEGGAPASSLYVDDGGRIGVGLSTPVVDIHVETGNTPTLRLEQDGSSGFTAQTWDLSGNEANFFIRDATNGSKLPLRIQPGAPNNALSIKSDGKIGIGTWSPTVNFHLFTADTWSTFWMQTASGANIQFASGPDNGWVGTQTSHDLHICVGDTSRIKIDTSGNVGIGVAQNAVLTHPLAMAGGAYCDGTDWHTGSSREYKEKIRSLSTDDAIGALNALEPVRFFYKSNNDDERLGFIAEDVPELVATKERKSMTPMDVVAVLTKVVQQQQKDAQELKGTISELKRRIAELEKRD